ncbi:precorrin-6A synthase (deacetylating) [Conexibacter sp. SYSU D00693]|uniref:precorrin-6A synthase (deacetylating) n=1 Tax=Conexibacter sp. SYSU D00693 TaxID=2812560 RepID=UPI00196B063B|nr:precorrin-6A synthase (deacetylating) [Conexibacter sp. SYSU D00693]
MRRVDVVGIGPGNPDQVTVEAVQALRAADAYVVWVKRDETAELVDTRAEVLDRHVGGDWRARLVELEDAPRGRAADPAQQRAAVAAWRAARSAKLADALRAAGDDARVAILAWGDPALYDSTLGVLEGVEDLELDVHVVPGISAASALVAAHRTGLNRVGGSVLVTTGRRLADGLPDGADDVVVLLDPDLRFREVQEEGVELLWGAYLGRPDELLVRGPLPQAGEEAARVRAEAAQRKGWMFDTYLLRRRRGSGR